MHRPSPIGCDLRHAPPPPFGLRPPASRSDTEAALGLLRLCFAKLLATLVGQPDAFGAGESRAGTEISARLWPFICFFKTRTVLVFEWGSSFAKATEDETGILLR